MRKLLSACRKILTNKVKICEFAITNVCTAKCQFCSIWQQKKKYIVDTEKALKTIGHLSRLGVKFITLTGGEPLIHPDFDKIVKKCTQENIISSILCADARLLTNKRITALKNSGIDLMVISIDHHQEEVCFEARKIPNLLSHITKAVIELKKRKIATMASILITNFNHNSLDKLFAKCKKIGFDLISINYPEFSESLVYTLGGNAIQLTRQQLISSLNDVIRAKKKYKIANPYLSIKSIIKYLNNEPPTYKCLGGYRAFFVDWFFNTYPCMYLNQNMGNVLQLKQDDFSKIYCNRCNMSWYRDFSIYFQGIKSLKPFIMKFPPILRYKFN